MENGFMLAGPNSGQERRTYNVPRGRSFIDFRIPALFLRPGIYWLSASLGSSGHVWDYVDKGWRVIVRSDDASDEQGPVRLLGRWSSEVDDSLTGEAV